MYDEQLRLIKMKTRHRLTGGEALSGPPPHGGRAGLERVQGCPTHCGSSQPGRVGSSRTPGPQCSARKPRSSRGRLETPGGRGRRCHGRPGRGPPAAGSRWGHASDSRPSPRVWLCMWPRGPGTGGEDAGTRGPRARASCPGRSRRAQRRRREPGSPGAQAAGVEDAPPVRPRPVALRPMCNRGARCRQATSTSDVKLSVRPFTCKMGKFRKSGELRSGTSHHKTTGESEQGRPGSPGSRAGRGAWNQCPLGGVGNQGEARVWAPGSRGCGDSTDPPTPAGSCPCDALPEGSFCDVVGGWRQDPVAGRPRWATVAFVSLTVEAT